MPRLSVPAMVAAARRYGLTVEVVPGAATRGSAAYAPKVFVGHHTAGPKSGIRPSLAICINGRGGANPVTGPLCNWFLDRNGVAVIVAAGVSNNAGKGGFRGVTGNSNTMGCEAESTGLGAGDWTDAQLWAYPRVVAAGLDLMGRDETWYASHRTWTPRKIDPAGISDDWMRTRVREVTADATHIKEDDMTPAECEAAVRKVFHLAAGGMRVPGGQTDNSGFFEATAGKLNAAFNADNAIKAALTAVRADTTLQGDDEAKVLAKLAEIQALLPTGGAS